MYFSTSIIITCIVALALADQDTPKRPERIAFDAFLANYSALNDIPHNIFFNMTFIFQVRTYLGERCTKDDETIKCPEWEYAETQNLKTSIVEQSMEWFKWGFRTLKVLNKRKLSNPKFFFRMQSYLLDHCKIDHAVLTCPEWKYTLPMEECSQFRDINCPIDPLEIFYGVGDNCKDDEK